MASYVPNIERNRNSMILGEYRNPYIYIELLYCFNNFLKFILFILREGDQEIYSLEIIGSITIHFLIDAFGSRNLLHFAIGNQEIGSPYSNHLEINHIPS